ncbi:hemolysin-III related-domain-containing protein [Rhodocollybia butyracea]|uniref:Hemolysin-III related-domain-containing protein n=1 Tax=Rhodocollybia butyracea TaxID=206335 RepID=A0A9P5QC86_9AGAR|nr:hemolysin-III related-domain-containing protein [Rhodocollybia butyracea]
MRLFLLRRAKIAYTYGSRAETKDIEIEKDFRKLKVVETPLEVARTASGGLLTWSELPVWMKDNEYIISGYRKEQRCWKGCFESVYLYLHNESVNIHSHLWGGVLFLYFLATTKSKYLADYPTTWLDTAVFSVFLVSAVFCLCSSAMFSHAFWQITNQCHAFDYSGIVVLTVGSFYPCVYYGFFCEPHLQVLYITSITLVGTGAAYIVLNPEYAKPTHRGARTTVFIALGLCAIVPVSHWVTVHGLQTMLAMGLHWLGLSGGFYIVGALLYANRIPERFAPGSFDYFFASHQIFHFFVVFAALAHYKSILVALHYAYTRSHCEL